MPSNITDYGQNFFAGSLFGRSFTPPATWWLALTAQTPDPSTNGTALLEPDPADGYHRVQFNNDGTVFGAPVGGVVANLVVIEFGIVTNNAWPVINSYALCDAETGGNVYVYGTIRTPRSPAVGNEVSFDVGLLTFSVNPISTPIVPAA